MADISKILTQAQADAEGVYAKAASIDPYQSALIKKNARGNIMSPGVLESLSALGVDGGSNAAKSIANIDAATRAARTANQMDVAQKKATQDFNNSNLGKFWSGVKGATRGFTTVAGTIYGGLNALYRTGDLNPINDIKNIGKSAEQIKKENLNKENVLTQTVAGQTIIKAVSDIKAGNFPKINQGEGFFPSEEVGVGHAARQASLSASKMAIKNSKGKIIGYQPRTLIGDGFANAFTLGNPESQAGAVISTVADIAGSFMFDSGIARLQRAKNLRKLAEQERVAGAMDVAAKYTDQAVKEEEAAARVAEAHTAVKNADTTIKAEKVSAATQDVNNARATWQGKNEEAIRTSIGVRQATARLEETTAFKNTKLDEITKMESAHQDLMAAVKAPRAIARTESAIAKQSDTLNEIKDGVASARERGFIAMYTDEEISAFENALQASKDKLAQLQGVSKEIPSEEAIAASRTAIDKAKGYLKDVQKAETAAKAQVAERTRNAKIAARLREVAGQNTLNAVKSKRTLREVLDDAQSTELDKQRALVDAIQTSSGIADNFERPELAYEKIADFLTGGHGSIAVNRLVEMTDWQSIWKRSGYKIDSTTAKALAEAKTQEDIVDILAPYIKRGDVVGGIMKPGLLERSGTRIADRVPFESAPVKYLTGVGARVQSRLLEHQKVAALWESTLKGSTKVKDFASREYKTKIRNGVIINIADRDELLRQVNDFGTAVKLDKAVLTKLIDDISNAEADSIAGYKASVGLLSATFDQFSAKVAPHLQEQFKKATTAFESSAEEMSSYWATRHAAGAELRYVTRKGDVIAMPGPHMDSELLNSTIYLPSTKEFMRLTSKLSNSKVLSLGIEYSDIAINTFWKNLQLVRPAFVIRNIAEEQIRVFATGHISFFNNPGMALAMWLGREDSTGIRKLLNQFDTYRHNAFDKAFSTGNDAEDILNETLSHDIANSYIDIMSADKAGSFDDRAIKVLQFKNVGAVAYGHKRFFDGVANQLRLLNGTEMARIVAGSNTASIKADIAKGLSREDAVVQYFLAGAGRKSVDTLAASKAENVAAWLKTPEGLKAYLFNAVDPDGKEISLLARITEATGGNKALMEIVAKGQTNIGSKVYKIPSATDSAINSISNGKQMRAGKKVLLDSQEAFAKELKEAFNKNGNWDGVSMNVPSRNLVHIESGKEKRGVVERFFDLATEFEKNSTFGPEYRQAYWGAMHDIAKALDSNAKAAMEKTAENSLRPLLFRGKNIGENHPVWRVFQSSKGDGPLTLEEAHTYADTVARNAVKNLFYDASSKRLIFHQLRLIAPFANAWEDTIKKWSELSIENPLQLYKGVKTLGWLQSPESSSLYQLTDARDTYDPNQGFFFTDPNSGQRMFWVPFAGTVMGKLAGAATGANYSGAPMAFSANPMSFNFALGAGSILPGIGPGITLPISVIGTFNQGFVDNLPEGIKNWLFPFGRSDFSSGLQSAILPGNWQKIIGGTLGMEQTYASNYKPVMNYLAGGGNYNLDDPEDQARLVNDTDTFSRWESIMRGVVGLFSPTALISQGLAKDENGDATTQIALYQDYQKMLQDNGGDYNKGWYDFLNLYGVSNAFALISASSGQGPSNLDAYSFVVKYPDVASKYSDVWGYVMPGGGLSNQMFKWNLVNGTKKKLTPKEILDKVNSQRFYAAKDALLTRVDAGEIDKTQFADALGYLKESMGGGPVVEFDPNKRNRVIIQLNDLAQDERFTDIPSVTALRDYMYLRQTSLDNLGKKTFTGAKNEQSERDWLAAQAEWIIQKNPDFQKMFYGFFANELEGK